MYGAPSRFPLEESTEIQIAPAGQKGETMNSENSPVTIRAESRGDTIYLIEYATSDHAKETAYQKVKRLIMNEPITLNDKAS